MTNSLQLHTDTYKNALDSLPTGIGFMCENYTLLYYNQSMKKVWGPNLEFLLGKKIYLEAGLEHKQLLNVHRQLKKKQVWDGCLELFGKKVEVNIAPIVPLSHTAPKDCFYSITVSDDLPVSNNKQISSEAKNLAEKMLNQTMTEILSHLSHELRTPLNAILGFTQLLKISSNLNDEQKDNIKEITSAGEHLLSMTNEILDLSSIEHGKLKLFSESINTASLINECVSLMQPLAEKEGIVIDHHESDISLVKDRVRLKQILINLLSNAVKYNIAGGKVVIKSFLLADAVFRIEIQDSGRGIPSSLQESIFRPFERLVEYKSEDIEGAGLGLMITRRLIKIMNGDIHVVSEPDCGSIFSIDFPVDTNKLSDLEELANHDNQSVLWVGENKCHFFAEKLIGLRPGVRFISCASLLEAKELCKQQPPSLLFIEVESPSLDQELATLVKDFPSVAVINTRYCSKEQFGTAAEFTDSLSTPVNTIDFMDILDRQLLF